MEIIFESDSVIVTTDFDGEVNVTIKQGMFTDAALHSLAKHIIALKTSLDHEIQQHVATLECTSEPTTRAYHYYAENFKDQLNTGGMVTLDVCDENDDKAYHIDKFLPKLKEKIVIDAFEKTGVKTNPADWVIKSLSRL